MAYNFPYLEDYNFLKKFDKLKLKEQFVKLVVLNFNEEPIQQVQGKVTEGSLNFDGTSAMRRTGNITLIATDNENDLTTTRNLFSINKKIEILVGFTNTTNEYSDYDMIWFPMGIYIIMDSSISHGNDGVTISLTLHDKMALLNGECGGTIPASVIFHQVEDIDEEGNIIITQPTIYQIIQQLVNHFGGQQLGKILISDIDNKVKKVMKWTGSTPLYLYRYSEGGVEYNHFSTNYNEAYSKGIIETFSYGEDVGFILSDFYYPIELISKGGDTVVSILDQIKNTLGNYEYFYDINGNFRFQQIKNYLNTSYSTIDKIEANNYLVNYVDGKSVYTFEDGDIIVSYSNNSQYQQIKNDFVVWGKKSDKIPIRYHLAIDKKPEIGNSYKVFFFNDPDDGINKVKVPLKFSSRQSFPTKGEYGLYYLDEDNGKIYKWDTQITPHNYVLTDYSLKVVTSNDFRSELLLAGAASEPLGLDTNYYYAELKNEWPKLYDIEGKEGDTPAFRKEILKQPSNIDFFLDFIDTTTAISEFSVANIGRRTKVINEDSINCVFEPDNPDIVLIESNTDHTSQDRADCEARNQEYVLVDSNIYSLLLTGGALRPAYEEIKKELYQYTSYNEQISLTTLPIYYLEPNTRITVQDPASGIFGDYMIKSISLPLSIDGTMSISCTRALERI